jgi:hypothetical protein
VCGPRKAAIENPTEGTETARKNKRALNPIGVLTHQLKQPTNDRNDATIDTKTINKSKHEVKYNIKQEIISVIIFVFLFFCDSDSTMYYGCGGLVGLNWLTGLGMFSTNLQTPVILVQAQSYNRYINNQSGTSSVSHTFT